MGQEVTRVTRVVLPDGTPVWARISGAAELPAPPGQLSYSDTGFAERVEASVESLNSLVTGVARSLAEPLRAVRPDEVSVQFGIELTAKAGKVVGLLADGEAKAGITVTLTWNGGPPDPHATDTADATDPPDTPRSDPAGAGGARSAGGEPSAPRAGASPGAPGHGGGRSAGSGDGA
ncbi:CU044_2847 family protein [Streptomyces sp. BK79]|uniref:CU044_2847 family protein n=1 Tax=Streptomyces sp. BK79 TaxID=3350097 RepID=UPI00376F6F42